MRRRQFVAIAGGLGLSGCLAGSDDQTDPNHSSTAADGTASPIRRTADGVTAAFRVVDSHAPTEDSASASFGDDSATVRGTMDPSGCATPTLRAVHVNATDGVVSLRVGGASPSEPTANADCGNASFDYRCEVSTDEARIEAVEVVHARRDGATQSFSLERD